MYGGASAGTGIAYAGVASLEVGTLTAAGIAALPIASVVLGATATGFLATWVDKRFNQGRISNQVNYLFLHTEQSNCIFLLLTCLSLSLYHCSHHYCYSKNYHVI